MAYQLAAYEPENRDDYLRLLQDAWGEFALTGPEFDWWFRDNPVGSIMSVAQEHGRVIGVAAHSLFRMVLAGEEKIASFSVHATTAAEARGKGIFEALERKHEEEATERGVAIVLAFASKPTAPIFLGPLGWTEIGRIRVWARPFPRFRSRRVEPTARVERFRHAGDSGASWPNHILRDAQYLNWRYIQSPRSYVPLAAGGSYSIVGSKSHRGTSVAYIADLIGDAAPLLRPSLLTVPSGVKGLVAIPGPGQGRAFRRAGFFPTRTRLHFMGKALAGELDTNLSSWQFSLGDTDFF
jgi:GNAT superfamily N-acetyltransferase